MEYMNPRCHWCGKACKLPYADPKHMYCSNRCKMAHWRAFKNWQKRALPTATTVTQNSRRRRSNQVTQNAGKKRTVRPS